MADTTAGSVLTDTRVLLNDANAHQYTDTVLLPYLKIAWDELAAVLAVHSIPVLKEVSADIDVDANENEISPAPTDLITPIKLQEKPRGTSDDLYQDMVPRYWEGSEYPPSAYINYWAWREQKFYLAPHTNDMTVRIFYIKDLSVLADANSVLAVNQC